MSGDLTGLCLYILLLYRPKNVLPLCQIEEDDSWSRVDFYVTDSTVTDLVLFVEMKKSKDQSSPLENEQYI